MDKPQVCFIFIATEAGAAMTAVQEIRAVTGKGLEGDRYFKQIGFYSDRPGPQREVTLIETETLEALQHESNIELHPWETRRNIVTRGVPLNHLVGREFRVGEVTLQGVRLCEPCEHLEELSGKKVRDALVHRAGLNARVVTEGVIRVGDAVEW